MRPIPGTITDPRLTPISDRDPGDEHVEPAALGGPKLTPAQWATLIKLANELPMILSDWLSADELSVLNALKSSRI